MLMVMFELIVVVVLTLSVMGDITKYIGNV